MPAAAPPTKAAMKPLPPASSATNHPITASAANGAAVVQPALDVQALPDAHGQDGARHDRLTERGVGGREDGRHDRALPELEVGEHREHLRPMGRTVRTPRRRHLMPIGRSSRGRTTASSRRFRRGGAACLLRRGKCARLIDSGPCGNVRCVMSATGPPPSPSPKPASVETAPERTASRNPWLWATAGVAILAIALGIWGLHERSNAN